MKEIEKMDGIQDFHIAEGTTISFPYHPDSFSDMWITNYIDRMPYLSSEEVIADYKANPANYYGMLIGIDEDGFDILTVGFAITYICFQSMNYMEIPF